MIIGSSHVYMALFQSCVGNMGEDVLSQEAEPAGRWKRPEVGALLSIMAVGENMGNNTMIFNLWTYGCNMM